MAKRLVAFGNDGDREYRYVGADWGDGGMDGTGGADGNSSDGPSFLSTLPDGFCGGTAISIVANRFYAVALAKSAIFGVVDGSFPWVSWPDDRGFACRYAGEASPNFAAGGAGICIFSGNGCDFISTDSTSDWPTGLADSPYGGDVLFLAGFYDGIHDAIAIKLDLFWSNCFGGIGYGDSIMASIETTGAF